MPSQTGSSRPGRPKGKSPPKRTTTVRLDQDLIDWINANVPRSVSLSAFVNQAVRDKIDKANKP